MNTRARIAHRSLGAVTALAAGLALCACSIDFGDDDDDGPRCADDDGSIALPDGFCAALVADDVGHARHMTVTPSGDLFIALADGDPMMGDETKGGVLALRDEDGDGTADRQIRFGDGGGNGIAWRDDVLYFAQNDRVLQWELPDGDLEPREDARVLVDGLPDDGDHTNKSIVFAPDGGMFVNIGSASNTCQVANRELESPGVDPCPELEIRAGIWHYPPDSLLRVSDEGERWASGVRNAVALAIEPTTGQLVAVQNGRDQLHENWPDLFTAEDDAMLPSEELFLVDRGADYGWPYCYHDGNLDQKVLAPEYGGDGETIGRCEAVEEPDATFPAHWAPLSIHFYRGEQFPAKYREGAFIAFHGNRFDPEPGEDLPGYSVEFAPFDGGRPTGEVLGFADDFAGDEGPLPDAAEHRPVGLAEAPDGSLYISDDKAGRIWRVYYGLHQ